MEGGALFDSQFLGGSFHWWMGQIADDSTWRENINAGKFESKQGIPGWGYRYKVRIMGLHEQSTDVIDSEELPWATVMYGVTDGSGLGNCGVTPALRQGNFVFGFFMDGPQQQVPVIMGVIGNNAQTLLQKFTELSGGMSYSGISAYAESKTPKLQTLDKCPDGDLCIQNPVGSEEKGDNRNALKVAQNGLAAASRGLNSAAPSLSSISSNISDGNVYTTTDNLMKTAKELRDRVQ